MFADAKTVIYSIMPTQQQYVIACQDDRPYSQCHI